VRLLAVPRTAAGRTQPRDQLDKLSEIFTC
jgi:hypothetical protein